MNTLFRTGLRWFSIVSVCFCVAFMLSRVALRTPWFKEHLYQRLLAGDEEQKLRAVSLLAQVGAESQLLRGLQSSDMAVYEMARRGLDHLWFNSAGAEAYEWMQSAYDLSEEKQYPEALKELNRILERYPNYAEALNRRAAILWQLERYEESRQDCERAIALNPNHYGAWQGLGLSQLQMGELEEACRSLRKALRIAPHDTVARRCLQKCEDLLRKLPGQVAPPPEADLL